MRPGSSDRGLECQVKELGLCAGAMGSHEGSRAGKEYDH